MYRPDASGFPPVHLNLGLYQDLLKNFPFNSGEEYQAFLNATSQSQASTVNSSAADKSPSTHEPPLSSTFSNSASRPKAFWKNLSFARKSYKVNPPTRRARATQRETCSIEMNPLNSVFEARTNKNNLNASRPFGTDRGSKKTTSTANGTADPHPPLPTSLVNEQAQIGVVDDSNLDDINLADADVHANL